MSKVYNSALQARVTQFLQDKQISQAKAAPLMGISQTALSQYRRSMYDNGDISALESKLEEFFKAQDEQDASTEKALPYKPIQDYIPTSISEDVYKLIRYCQLEKGMVIIHGDAGIGKTKGAEKFVRDNPTSSVYIHRHPGQPFEDAGAGAAGARKPQQAGAGPFHPGEAGGHQPGYYH